MVESHVKAVFAHIGNGSAVLSDQLDLPPISLEVDLRDFVFMPLDVLRLRDSGLAGVQSAEIFRVSVLSWCVAWHQLPAGSLPDDDQELSRLMGYGRDLRGWKRLRAKGGMWGWVKCSDGRLYHPVVVEKAKEAWEAKLARKARTEAARLAKQRQLHGLSHPDKRPVTDPVTDPVTSSKGQDRTGTGKRQGQGYSEEDPTQPFPSEPGRADLRRRANGTNPRSVGDNPRAIGANPRAARNASKAAYVRVTTATAKVRANNRTWADVLADTADDPGIQFALMALGDGEFGPGCRLVADADKFTRADIEERFRSAYEAAAPAEAEAS